MTIFFVHVTWSVYDEPLEAIGNMAICLILVSSIYGFTYWLGRRVARTQYEPQRRELLALLDQLDDNTTGDVIGEYSMLMSAMRVECSLRRKVIGWVLAAVFLAIGIGGIVYGYKMDPGGYPKLAPFTDVQWGEDVPVVELDGEWHLLFSIDGLDVREIVAFCQKTYGAKWQKRFGEDLVQVLSEMGHAPKNTVRLDILSTGPDATRSIKEVAMTAANRRKVRATAEKREAELVEPEGLTSKRDVPVVAHGSAALLVEDLESIRAAYKLPALAAFALRGDTIVEQAVVGKLSAKETVAVGMEAQWHLGSNTKAMTATVAGMLVEEGLLRWETTIGEVLGDAAPEMDAGHRDTTLAMLLHHTSGITANIDWFAAPEDRVACVAQILSTSPKDRGEYAYSNAGYVVAGAMMEVVTGKRWEDLMGERLFAPLGMTSTGFGAPTKPGSPWGHESGFLGWSPKNPTARNADNAPVLGPAGTVHTTMDDYARFIASHLKGAQGQGGIVSAETFKTLHAPLPGGNYGMGWIITERDWAGGRALTHGGSNTLWFATVWIAPEKDMAFFAVTNAGGDTAFEAVDKAIGAMIGRHLRG
jgi:CubicO group peptidase (beta-lactamase class C family)/cbb3-type cytochrome oxidase subunit 3